MHGYTIEDVTATKYLGVNIQDNMKWGTHINTVTNKANKTLGFLRRNLKIGKKKQRKLRTKPLFDRCLSMQPQSGIPTLKMRSAPSRKSNAERQDGSQTDAAKYRASVPSGTLWNGHLFNNAAESPIGYVFQAPP